ncbi:uncharacterized protein LOC135818268 [Sycon ciliatum]|uniref:uncharacterized protein LOC135818268 n=1 Tax=Sycon ciliatum TaxID=27933 RepID=UPI0031F6EAC1
MEVSGNPLLASSDEEREKLYRQLISPDAVIAEKDLFNIARVMVDNGRRYPDRLCMSFAGGVTCTFAQMLALASDIYTVLKERGLKEEDRLLATMKPGVVFYATVIAAWALGLVIVLIDKGNFKSITKVNHCLTLAKPKAWLRIGTEFWYTKWIFSSIRAIPMLIELPTGISGPFLSPDARHLLSADDVCSARNALVTFTSGSTGLPKMILRHHSFVMKQVLSITACDFDAQQRDLNPAGRTPLLGEMVNLTNLPVGALVFIAIGAPCILETDILGSNVDEILSRCRSAKQTTGRQHCSCIGSPAFLQRIVQHCIATKQDVPITIGHTGGAPIYSRLNTLLHGNTKSCFAIYGSTEAEPISSIGTWEKIQREAAARKIASSLGGHCVGKPHFPGSLAIIKQHDGQIPDDVVLEDLQLDCGQAGEVVLRGWSVNMHEVPRKRFLFDRQGRKWLRMDDGAYLDKDGYVWVVGRMTWKVERDGREFWSVIVEEKMMSQCSLITYATYMKRDGKAHLFIEAPNGLPESELESLKQCIKRDGIPVDSFRVMTEIPRDARHASKPNTAALFASSWSSSWQPFMLVLLVIALLVLVITMLRMT